MEEKWSTSIYFKYKYCNSIFEKCSLVEGRRNQSEHSITSNMVQMIFLIITRSLHFYKLQEDFGLNSNINKSSKQSILNFV